MALWQELMKMTYPERYNYLDTLETETNAKIRIRPTLDLMSEIRWKRQCSTSSDLLEEDDLEKGIAVMLLSLQNKDCSDRHGSECLPPIEFLKNFLYTSGKWGREARRSRRVLTKSRGVTDGDSAFEGKILPCRKETW